MTSVGLLAVARRCGHLLPVLGLAAGCVYVGLNATATAHRAVVVERFEDDGPTGGDELAGAIDAGRRAAGRRASAESHRRQPAWLLFVVAAAVAPLLAVPTVMLLRRMERRPRHSSREEKSPDASLRAAIRRPGAREVLLAQILWVAGYVALPSSSCSTPITSSISARGPRPAMLAGFGILTGAAMVVAGRARPERVFPLLLVGAALLGGGLVAAAPAGSAAAAGSRSRRRRSAPAWSRRSASRTSRASSRREAGSYSGLFFSCVRSGDRRSRWPGA